MNNYQLSANRQAKLIQRSYNKMQLYVQSEMAKILRHAGGPDTLAYEYRMKRLNALLINTEKRMKELYGISLGDTTAFLKKIIPEAYYHTIFDIAKGVGAQPVFSAVNARLIDKVMNEDWSGENYSKRIWRNTNRLAGNIREVMTQAAMSGESIYKTARKLSDAFNTNAYNGVRLIRTETTYACNQAEMLSYKSLDIDKYKYVATFSERTCDVCSKQDGKIFTADEFKSGVNLPPMHPNCRCTTIAYFEEGMPQMRIAKDKDGKNITIPAKMTYNEWYDKYIKPTEGEKSPQKPPKAQPGKSVPVEIPAPQGSDSGYTDVKIPKRGK